MAYMPGEAEMPSFFLRSSVRSAISSKFMLHISSTSRCTLGLPTSRSCSGSLSRGSGAAAYHLHCLLLSSTPDAQQPHPLDHFGHCHGRSHGLPQLQQCGSGSLVCARSILRQPCQRSHVAELHHGKKEVRGAVRTLTLLYIQHQLITCNQ